jgi:hypothetical protein
MKSETSKSATGAVSKQIQDVNTSSGSGFTGLPTGWQDTVGANLFTTYQVDAQGRATEETDPDDDTTYTIYDDADHEVRVYPEDTRTNGVRTIFLLTRVRGGLRDAFDFGREIALSVNLARHRSGQGAYNEPTRYVGRERRAHYAGRDGRYGWQLRLNRG